MEVTRIPSRGLVLLKRPELESSLGRIVLLDATVAGWTAGQGEVLAVGPAREPEEDEEPYTVDPRVKPGAWVVTRMRRWALTDVDGEYLIRVEDIVGVLT